MSTAPGLRRHRGRRRSLHRLPATPQPRPTLLDNRDVHRATTLVPCDDAGPSRALVVERARHLRGGRSRGAQQQASKQIPVKNRGATTAAAPSAVALRDRAAVSTSVGAARRAVTASRRSYNSIGRSERTSGSKRIGGAKRIRPPYVIH